MQNTSIAGQHHRGWRGKGNSIKWWAMLDINVFSLNKIQYPFPKVIFSVWPGKFWFLTNTHPLKIHVNLLIGGYGYYSESRQSQFHFLTSSCVLVLRQKMKPYRWSLLDRQRPALWLRCWTLGQMTWGKWCVGQVAMEMNPIQGLMFCKIIWKWHYVNLTDLFIAMILFLTLQLWAQQDIFRRHSWVSQCLPWWHR